VLRKLFAIALAATFPFYLYAMIYHVPEEFPIVPEAVMVAVDGDTIMVPEGSSYGESDKMGKEITFVINNIEPKDAEPDSTIYGPQEPFPPTPVE